VREDRGGLGREVAAELGEDDAAAAALEERLAELVLERVDLAAERRLRDAEPAGRAMHMDPSVSHVGRAETGHRLREGMAFTVEPMINAGTSEVNALSAQFEHTVLIAPNGPEITTVLDPS